MDQAVRSGTKFVPSDLQDAVNTTINLPHLVVPGLPGSIGQEPGACVQGAPGESLVQAPEGNPKGGGLPATVTPSLAEGG